jgi:hypothetical protein
LLVGDIQDPESLRFTFAGNQAWKNREGGYRNRVAAPGLYTGWTVADNEQVDFSGQAGHDVHLRSTLLVGVSLNNGNSAETRADNTRRAAFISYDEAFIAQHIIAVNYPLREPPTYTRANYGGQTNNIQGGALVRMGEYLFSVWTFTEYLGWKLVNCATGYMCQPPHLDGNAISAPEHMHSLGILRDVTGVFTGVPGRHVVWNEPFLTTDATNLAVWHNAEAQSTDSTYYGMQSHVASGIWTNQFLAQQPIDVDRLDSGGSVVGSWNVPDSRVGGGNLSHFKPVAVMKDGIYKWGWAGEIPSGTNKFATFNMSFLRTTSDKFTLGVPWPNGTTVGTIYQRYATENDSDAGVVSAFEIANTAGSPPLPYAKKAVNTGMTSKADVVAATTFVYWQDTTNNVVWIKVVGGQVYDSEAKHSALDENLAFVDGPIINPSRTINLSIR